MHTLADFEAASPSDDYHQTTHAVMPRPEVDEKLHTLALTYAISHLAFSMLKLPLPSRHFDVQCLHDMDAETKATGTDGLTHLVAPTGYASDELAEALFPKLFDGSLDVVIVEGENRSKLAAFIKKRGGFASPLSHATLEALGKNECDWETDMIATNAGSIFLVYLDGHMTLAVLRPSIGSWYFENARKEGMHGQVSLARRALARVQLRRQALRHTRRARTLSRRASTTRRTRSASARGARRGSPEWQGDGPGHLQLRSSPGPHQPEGVHAAWHVQVPGLVRQGVQDPGLPRGPHSKVQPEEQAGGAGPKQMQAARIQILATGCSAR